MPKRIHQIMNWVDQARLDFYSDIRYFFGMITKLDIFCLFCLLLVATSSLVNNANAAISDWQDLGGGKIRLVAISDPGTNTVKGVIEVKLKEGWKTYWRDSAGAGIPPRFDFSASRNFTAQSPKFPTPILFKSKYGAHAGYKGTTRFPFEGKIGSSGNTKVEVDILIGVCEVICIPATAKLAIEGVELKRSDPAALQMITMAGFSLPKQVLLEEYLLSINPIDGKKLQIHVKNPKNSKAPELLVEGPQNWYLTPAVFKGKEGEAAVFDLDLGKAAGKIDLDNAKLRFTILNGQQGVEFQN